MNPRVEPRGVGLTPVERRTCLVAIAVFAVLAIDVMVGGPASHFDDAIRDQLIAHAIGAPGVFAPLGLVGDPGVAIAVVLTAAAVSCQVSWRLWPAVFAVGVFAITEILVLVSKLVVGRPGPGVWAEREDYPGYFPSGHTATATAVAGITAFLIFAVPRDSRRRPQAGTIALSFGLAVGLGAGAYAVLSDSHWSTDVIGGLALAAPVLVVGCALVRTRIYTMQSADHQP